MNEKKEERRMKEKCSEVEREGEWKKCDEVGREKWKERKEDNEREVLGSWEKKEIRRMKENCCEVGKEKKGEWKKNFM